MCSCDEVTESNLLCLSAECNNVDIYSCVKCPLGVATAERAVPSSPFSNPWLSELEQHSLSSLRFMAPSRVASADNDPGCFMLDKGVPPRRVLAIM
ncbi:hypothetical protein ACKS0A_07587 [Histoplasma ohiense]